MLKRIFSTLTLWLMIIASIYLWQASAGVLLLTVFTALTQFEFYQLLRKMGYAPMRWLGLVLGVLLMLGTWYGPLCWGWHPLEVPVGVVALGTSLLCLMLLVTPCKPGVPNPLMPTLFGLLYIPFLMQFYTQILLHYTLLETPNTGLALAIWLVATAKFSDVGGLILGSQFGRNKLAPLISPGKTWEGAAGGILTSVLLGSALFTLMTPWLPEAFRLSHACLLALIVSPVAIASDLIQSAIKRQAQSKDSGFLIPGIGGIFDLTDSLLLSAPVAYYFLCSLW